MPLDDDQHGRVRALGENKEFEIIANGRDDVASIPGILAGHTGFPVTTGEILRPHIHHFMLSASCLSKAFMLDFIEALLPHYPGFSIPFSMQATFQCQ